MITALLSLFNIVEFSFIPVNIQHLFQRCFQPWIRFMSVIEADIRNIKRITIIMGTDSQRSIGIYSPQAALIFQSSGKRSNCKCTSFCICIKLFSDTPKRRFGFWNQISPAIIQFLNPVTFPKTSYRNKLPFFSILIYTLGILQNVNIKFCRSIEMLFINGGWLYLQNCTKIITTSGLRLTSCPDQYPQKSKK